MPAPGSLTAFAPGKIKRAEVQGNDETLRTAAMTAVYVDQAAQVAAVHNFVNGLQVGGDSIIAEGSNANGRYIRFAGGLQICWGIYSPSAYAINTAVGSLYRSGLFTLTWPAAFVGATPATSIFQASPLSDGPVWANGVQSGLSSQGFNVLCPLSVASTTVAWGFIAIGRWK